MCYIFIFIFNGFIISYLFKEIFHGAYWANAVPSYIEDDKDYVAGLRKSVKKVIKERQTKKDKFHVGLGNKFKAFFKDKALVTDLQSVTQVRWGFCSKQKGTRKNY